LVLGAGAIHSSARLKSIIAKHLALVTQCLELVVVIIPHIRDTLMAQLTSNQHVLLEEIDKIQKEMSDHNERVLSKFVSIIGGIVEHGLAPKILKTDFDAIALNSQQRPPSMSPFLEGIAINTKKMHQVLSILLPEEHLQDVFCRIYAYIDHKIPMLFFTAAEQNQPTLATTNHVSSKTENIAVVNTPSFSLPTTESGQKRMLYEVQMLITGLNKLSGVRTWDFSAYEVLELKFDMRSTAENHDEQNLLNGEIEVEQDCSKQNNE